MNPRTIKWLAIAVIALLALTFIVERANRSDTVTGGERLLPGLKDQLNDVVKLVVTGSGGTVTVLRDGDRWTVLERNGFPANTGKLREALLALADARKLEQKTSNPERLAQLGLDDPPDGSGRRIDIYGDGFSYALVIGNEAQSTNRYVRLADDNQAWLIDKNPDLADTAAGWLVPELLDIDASRIRSVTVTHDDGESIHLDKAEPTDSNFVVSEIPAGRELTYATVANGIAGVLKGLELEDVRQAGDGEPVSTTVFTTFDGLVVTVRRYKEDASDDDEGDGEEKFWFTIDAEYVAPVVAAEAASESDEVAIDDTTDDEPAGASAEPDAESTAAAINAQHAGWQYRIPEYKANLIARRWSDILKAKEEKK